MTTERRPTLRDVADRAGVSFKSVSRVVNRERGVSAELRARVEAAIDELGYRPDHRARLLRRGGVKASTIGFVLVDVANPFFSSLLRGIEEEATTRDCLVLAGSTGGSASREHQLIEAFVGRRVDGLIVVTSETESGPLQSELARGTPVVFLDLEPDEDNVDLVRSDHHAGSLTATRHLLDHGHTDIAYYGDDATIFSARLRRQGYLDAMTAAGLDPSPRRQTTASRTTEQWHEFIHDQLSSDEPPSAMFTAQNFVTLGAVQALHDLELQRSVALVGFDDVDLAAVVQPGITVVAQQPRELGRRAAAVLFDRIGGETGPPVREIVATSLIARGSGELPPG